MLFCAYKGQAQDIMALGMNYQQVKKHTKELTHVNLPKVEQSSNGHLNLFFDCTGDDGTNRMFITYSFNNKRVCYLLTVAYKGRFDKNFEHELNDYYQYSGDMVWIDHKHNVKVSVSDHQEDMNGFFVYYTKL
ncbi:MAG: hypothetical protein NVSMB24_06610 [Mucilaginibacter sp.]